MAKNLGGAIIDLLDSERVDLRAAAATVLAAVGKSDKSVQSALTGRLEDPDLSVKNWIAATAPWRRLSTDRAQD